MKNLDSYLEQIQGTGVSSASGMGFAIDSPHIHRRTLTDKIEEEDKDKDEDKENN